MSISDGNGVFLTLHNTTPQHTTPFFQLSGVVCAVSWYVYSQAHSISFTGTPLLTVLVEHIIEIEAEDTGIFPKKAIRNGAHRNRGFNILTSLLTEGIRWEKDQI